MAVPRRQQEPIVSVAALDDDRRIGSTIRTYLEPLACDVRVYTDPRKCLSAISDSPVDMLITDLRMPGMDGLDLLREVKEKTPCTDVIVLTGSADKKDAVQALKFGAFDFFEKPIDRTELTETIKKTVRYRSVLDERNRFAQQVSFLSRREAAQWGTDAFIGKSAPVREVIRTVGLLQGFDHTSVLIMGESGTGKELVARAVHFGSPRANRPFVPVNCSAVPSELAESTLFGHVKGAFTGAAADKKGCFELAHEGTLFLDEIGDMPPAIQAKLLRVLEDGIVVPVGGTKKQRVDVRVIAATNADMPDKLASNAFRSDLYYRLAGYTMSTPTLRDRREDIPLLAAHFTAQFAGQMGIQAPEITPEALDKLRSHPFPGNVRELRNTIGRALIESGGKPIQRRHIHSLNIAPQLDDGPQTDVPAGEETVEHPFNLQAAEAIVIRRAMAAAQGNVSKAARLLGISRAKLYRKLSAIVPAGC